ncbi:glycosyltransferase family 2 protein [Pseudoalteromonas sp. AOP31-A2-14]|uniref:glycosyltransferase family 2 protein n=1 Tax=Pseudoalteromonas sp. AOP31-A2-14 TaxID=3457695 RepID=UPI0040353959
MPDKLFNIDAFRTEPLPTEAEVMANWQGDIEKPMVSILCNTYNQKIYIEDAFRGFLIQQTGFVFEVIIHDDASTDGTSDIVREYAKRYPKIFKPVIQTENQYSQKKKIISISASYAKGEYIAICEGDDFWIDEFKLNKQVNALLELPNLKLCFTAALSLDQNNCTKVIASYNNDKLIIPSSEVIQGGGDFIPTASIVMHSSVMKSLPTWFASAPVGDIFIQINGAKDGGALYLPDHTTVYRVEALGSWSASQKLVSEDKIKNNVELLVKCYSLLAQGSTYKSDFEQAILNVYISNALKAISQKRYGLAKYFIDMSKTIPINSKRKLTLICFKYFLPLFRFLKNALKSKV